MKTLTEILQSVARYAEAYAEIQDAQKTSPLIPEGDQKTGCIGELYGYLYLARVNPGATLTYGSHSEKGWDIECKPEAKPTPTRIQIKTVSAYSKTRTISPIHHGWDQLFIVYLDRDFAPTGFGSLPIARSLPTAKSVGDASAVIQRRPEQDHRHCRLAKIELASCRRPSMPKSVA